MVLQKNIFETLVLVWVCKILDRRVQANNAHLIKVLKILLKVTT